MHVYHTLLFALVFKYVRYVFLLTLGQFGAYISAVTWFFFLSLFSYRSSGTQLRRLLLFLSPPFLQEDLVIFVLKRRRLALEKAGMTSALPAAILATGGSIVPTSTPTSQLDQCTSSSQIKTAPLLGSNDSTSEHIVVREMLEGISDDVPPSEESF